MTPFEEMTREELLKTCRSFAKSWLAHDGCWFLAAEERYGLETAIELDTEAWRRFARVEAARIMETHGIAEGGGLEALEKALSLRMYGLLNRQHSEWTLEGTLRVYTDTCRVQAARRRKGLADFPCASVGEVEYGTFARTVDPQIITRRMYCPPDAPEGHFCAWEFSLGEELHPRSDG